MPSQEDGRREERVPRHGSAAPGADVESVQVTPRGSSMAAWTIRRKLGLLVTIPLIVLLVGGGVLVSSLSIQYRQAHNARVDADALLTTLTTGKTLLDELGGHPTTQAEVKALRGRTDTEVKGLRPTLAKLAKGDPNGSTVPVQAQATLDALDSLSSSRNLIDRLSAQVDPVQKIPVVMTQAGTTQVNGSTITLLNAFQNLIQGLSGDLAVVAPNRQTTAGANFVASMSAYDVAAAREKQIFDGVWRPAGDADTLNQDRFSQWQEYVATQVIAANNAVAIATPEQQKQLAALSSENDARMINWRSSLTDLLNNDNAQKGDLTAFDPFAAKRIDTIDKINVQAATDTLDNARSQETSALFRVAAVAGAVLLTLLVVTALLATIARTITVPMRRLRAGAVEVASVQLPAAVARIEQDGVNADISLPPVLPADAFAGPETLEVARAVDDLGAEAVRLATAQVRLRRALDEAFVSMSRRSQSMVEKQLAIIDELESQEQDPDQLRNLFRLDHLAARMRRYNDNLLVLAGSAVRTRATAPVKIAELFRAATSEMEQYERVRLQPVSGASIAGTVAGELVHLLAELLDNAAMYSPPSSAIVLSAAFTADAGLQIEVLDAGVGISPGELDRLNGRLSQPESIDTQVPSRMGLFVVARLARRGTFGVMLQARPDASGTIALVRVPATLVIGAPGSTGEVPVLPTGIQQRQPAQIQSDPNRQSQYAAYGPPAALGQLPSTPIPAGQLAPAAAAAGVAAEAAAQVRKVAADDAALPRRRRAASGSPNAGLPPEAIAAASSPATGLFTPITPPSEETGERQNAAPAVARTPSYPPAPTYQPPAPTYQPTAPTYQPQAQFPSATPPPPTSPTGIGLAAFPSLPARNPGQQPAQPYSNPWDAAPFSTPGSAPSTDSPFIPHVPVDEPIEDEHHFDTPAAGITGLPGLAPPVRRGIAALQNRDQYDRSGQTGQNPLTAPAGLFRATPNPSVPAEPAPGNGGGDWNDDLPTELAARAAAAAAYRPSDPNLPMIGDDVQPDFNDPTPIFDQISVWFTAEDDAPEVSADVDHDQVIDLRDQDERRPSSRWASLGDQRWLATNARAAAAPDTEGTTETGLPKRRPGANLLPSAATTAPPPINRPAPVRSSEDAEQNAQEAALVRGRLGSYQRGLANARRARTQPSPAPVFDPVGASLFTVNSEAGDDAGRHSGDQGGDQ